ncbi:MmgE/PrpD family protein [Seminibacterium arietis]|uniref:MmgE/PrpD family protein n=1 Tax=Seminibacterium arietis TaxID=1173502 RepID=A0ABW3I8P6_9PAST
MQQLTTKGIYSVWGKTISLSADYAAMVNGVSSHILDFDDTHTSAILHGSAILTPLCLTYGFSQCSDGKKILKAFIVGWEIAARVGSASKGTFHKRGFHSTAIAGIFGAIASMSVILNLNKEQIINAFGLAGSFASGVNEFLANGSNSKVMHIANVIKNSILIAHITKVGVTGPSTIFEGRDNIFKCFGLLNEIDITCLDKNLGSCWEILTISIKPYPCCHFAHGLIDCIKSLRIDGIRDQDIIHITCFVDTVPINFICSPIERKRNPKTEYEAKFAMPFLLALMFFDGDITLASYKNLHRPEILNFANKISYQERSSLGFPKYFPGHMEVKLKTGKILKKDILINKGNGDNPLSKEELERKFFSNVNGIITKPNIILDYIYNLEQQTATLDIK